MKKRQLGLVVLFFVLMELCACGSSSQDEPDFTYIPKADEYTTEESAPATSNSEKADTHPDESTGELNLGTAPETGEYDKVLACGDGYYLVSKWIENYKEAYTEYGVINQDGDWLVPLANDNEIAKAIDELPIDRGHTVDPEQRFEYANNGMFVARESGHIIPEADENWDWNAFEQMYGCCMINGVTGHCFSVGPFTTRYYDGYCFFLRRNWKTLEVMRVDTNGEESVFYSDPSNKVFAVSTSGYNCFGIENNKGYTRHFGEPSNGLIYLGQVFYDIETSEAVIDLTEYDMNDIPGQFPLKFDDSGTFTFKFRNPARTMYEATIDINGNFVEEPHEI